MRGARALGVLATGLRLGTAPGIRSGWATDRPATGRRHATRALGHGDVLVLAMIPALLVGCLPAELGGMPPSFDAFLRRNGMEFTRRAPPPAADPAAIADIAQSEGPNPRAAVNPPVYGVLTCPFACSGAVLSRPGERIEAWFVSFPGTEYGAGDIAWVIVDPAMGVRVVSTRDNP